MRRRSKADGEPTEGRSGRSLVRPKARKAPTTHLTTADLKEQLVRLRRERDEALEQLEATSEVLRDYQNFCVRRLSIMHARNAL
jgi:hypothetical protein